MMMLNKYLLLFTYFLHAAETEKVLLVRDGDTVGRCLHVVTCPEIHKIHHFSACVSTKTI